MLPEDLYFSGLNAVYNFGGYFSIPAGDNWSLATSSFEQCKFYFITQGTCQITIEGTEYTARAGDWFFIPAKTKHAYQNCKDAPFAKYWMHFDLYPDARLFRLLNLPYRVKADPEGRALRLFQEFDAALAGGRFTDSLTVKARLIELIAEYIKAANADVDEVERDGSQRFDSLLRYINENLHRPLSNEQLARIYHMHPNHFVRSFKEKTGQTPARYVKNKKLENARQLLENTQMPICDIAAKVGYPDPAHFSRLFRERYGMSPTVCRAYFKRSLRI